MKPDVRLSLFFGPQGNHGLRTPFAGAPDRSLYIRRVGVASFAGANAAKARIRHRLIYRAVIRSD